MIKIPRNDILMRRRDSVNFRLEGLGGEEPLKPKPLKSAAASCS